MTENKNPEVSRDQVFEQDKEKQQYWIQIKEADKKLRNKFGNLLSDWKPSTTNILLLNEEDYKKQYLDWNPEYINHWGKNEENMMGYCYFETQTIAFNLNQFNRDYATFRFYAAHEMIHAHTRTSEATIDFSKLPSGLEDVSEGRKSVWANLINEELVDHLSIKALKLFEKDIDRLPYDLMVATLYSLNISEILDHLGGNVDQALFQIVQGKEPQDFIRRADEFFGPNFYYYQFIPALISLGMSQDRDISKDLGEQHAQFFAGQVEYAVLKKGRVNLLSRPDAERASTIIRNHLASEQNIQS